MVATAASTHRCGIHSILVDQLFFQRRSLNEIKVNVEALFLHIAFSVGKPPTELSKNGIRLAEGLTLPDLFESRDLILLST